MIMNAEIWKWLLNIHVSKDKWTDMLTQPIVLHRVYVEKKRAQVKEKISIFKFKNFILRFYLFWENKSQRNLINRQIFLKSVLNFRLWNALSLIKKRSVQRANMISKIMTEQFLAFDRLLMAKYVVGNRVIVISCSHTKTLVKCINVPVLYYLPMPQA